MGFTTYTDDNIVNALYGGVALAVPATLYVGLSSTQPTVAGGNITEPIIGTNGYTRVAVTNNTTNFPTTSSDAKSNGTAITFPNSTGAWLSGVALGYFCIYDASSGGNLLAYAALNSPQAVAGSGSTISFAAGAMTITIN
jgi:hypothetical protein